MNGWYSVDSWMDVLDHFLLVIGAIAVIAVPSWFSARNHKELKTTQRTLGDVRDQVVNSHPDRNLRDDIDRAIAAVEAMAKDVAALRHDLLTERESRRAQVADLAADVDRMRRR